MPVISPLCRVLIRALLCLSLLAAAAPTAYAHNTSEHERRVDSLLQRMTLEQKVGQLFLVFFNGQDLSPSLLRSIRDYHVGGIVFFQSNIVSARQTAALINAAQQEAISSTLGVPLFVAADQEGGLIARMPPPAPAFPSQMALGAVDDPDLVARVAQAQSRLIKALGFNMNLAPVLDVNDNADNPIIGTRSFSADPAIVAKLGTRMLQTYRANGVVAVAKHFPGHGSTSVDSHNALPTVRKSAAEIEALELAPFKSAVQGGVDALMTGHIVYPAIDNSGLPATLSSNILQGVLRKQLGYTGLIMSDSMSMDAIDSRYTVAEATVMAFRAGVDIIAIGADLGVTPAEARRDYQVLLRAIRKDSGLQERLDQSVRRILLTKSRYGILDWAPVDADAAEAELASPEVLAVAREAAQRSVTVARNDGQVPVAASQKLLLIAPRERDKLGVYASDDAVNAIRACHPNLEIALVGLRPSGVEIRRVVQQSKDYASVLVITLNARFYYEQAALVRALRRPIVAAVRNPYDGRVVPNAGAFIATYSDAPVSMAALAEVICGRLAAGGKLPVAVPEAAAVPATPAAGATPAVRLITATPDATSKGPVGVARPLAPARRAVVTRPPAARRPIVRRPVVRATPRPAVRRPLGVPPVDPLPPPPP